MFCCGDTTGLLYTACHLQSGRSAMNSLFRGAASREWKLIQLWSLKQQKNLSYCISGYKFTFLISLAFSSQPHRPIQMSLAMTYLFINMYADNQPKRIIKLLLSSYSFFGLPEHEGEQKLSKCTWWISPILPSPWFFCPVHLDQVGWSAPIKRHLKRILYLLLL